jgi:hypothetical protein
MADKSPHRTGPKALKRLAILAFFAATGLTAYRLASGHADITAPDPLPTATPAAAPPASAALPVSAPKTSAHAITQTIPVKAAAPGGPPQSDGHTVEFQVVEGGLAVAYGDVILGKVETGTTAKTGRYEPAGPQLWDKPEIPYSISPDLPNPSRVEKAVEYFNSHTPVSFVPYANQADAVVFEPGEEHCYSSLGKTGGLQPIRLSAGCQPQEIMHEMMHALGFVHEQSRPDRDQYVQVLWENIDEKFQPQFAVVPDLLMEAERGTAFDFHSIMLYRPDTFALHAGLMTLQPVAGKPPIEPASTGLSEGDISRLKRMYRL